MELTPVEEKMFAVLRLEERWWTWFRWIRLIVAIGMTASVILLVATMLRGIREHPQIADSLMLAFALVWPVVFVAGLIGLAAAVHTIMCWRGKPERKLLLRVVEELKKEDRSQSGGR